jgi:L-ascorbate metabolism protein UlaG (beta-lactamase superfamily)
VHITFLGHAGLFVNAAGKSLLIDPWFSEPVFGAAWFRYPPAPYPDATTMPRPDFLLLSHIHPDHSGPGTLAQMQKGTSTWALPFPSGALKRRLDRAGYTNVHWLQSWETQELAPGLKVTFVAHDRGWEVSSIVIEADGVRLYHGNDNPLSVACYKEIVQRLGTIDIAFLPYAGASSYPTGFNGDEATLQERCAKKKAEGLARFTEGIEGLTPSEAVPFASSWALLEPSELWKNYVDRLTADEALVQASPKAAAVGTHLVRLQSGDEWSPETGPLPKGLTEGWDHSADSVRRYAEQEKDRVARAIAAGRLAPPHVDAGKLDRAFRKYLDDMLTRSAESIAQLSMKAGFEATGAGAWSVEFIPGQAPRVEAGLKGDEHEVLTLEAGELWNIVAAPANWEDVWYGYRLKVKKAPGAGYYRAFWEMLLNFDDEQLSERIGKEFGGA